MDNLGDMSDWQQDMVATVGAQVQKHRGDRSLLWLENRTKELGHKVARSGLSQLENGKRQSISIAELLVLAAALEVPPAFLIWPQYPEGAAELLPSITVPAGKAHGALIGENTFQSIDNDGTKMTIVSNAPYPLFALFQELRNTPDVELFKDSFLGEDGAKKYRDLLESQQAKLRELRTEIYARGGYIMTSDERKTAISEDGLKATLSNPETFKKYSDTEN